MDEQVDLARGDAVAVRENVKRVRADVLTAHMTKDKAKPAETKPGARLAKRAPSSPTAKPGAAAGLPGASDESSRISRIDAQGNVIVSTGDNAIRGQYAVVDLNNNVSRMMPTAGNPGSPRSRVEGLFVRQDLSGVPGGQTPSATPGSGQKP